MPVQQHRITIQLDLSGYSFTVYDRNGTQLSEERRKCPIDLAVEELKPVLSGQYSSVSVYVATWKHTLVPQNRFRKESSRESLQAVRDILPEDTVLSLDMPSHKAVMIYAVPGAVYDGLSKVCRNVKFYPLSYILIDRLSCINDNNRLIVSFSEGMLHVVAGERNRLLFVNSFPAGDMATAEYFIFSVVREVLFNPEHTCLYVYGRLEDGIRSELQKYFMDVNILS